jgi:thiol-disulfide isomerase/thioredoxin
MMLSAGRHAWITASTLVVVTTLVLMQSLRAEQRLSEVDRTLPQFDLPAMDSTRWQAQSLQGKPWVINFWATWCPPCIEEIPSMNAAWQVLEDQGVGMLAINAGEGQAAVQAFLEKVPIDFPTLLGDANSLPNWSIRGLPTTIVVSADGEVVYEALGPREWDDEALLQLVLELL